MPPAPKSAPRLVLIYGDDDYAVKQRARQIFQEWCGELGGMDHEVIDARAAHSGDALKAVARLREALQTLPFFGDGKAIWWQGCNFLGSDRTSQAQAVTEAAGELAQEFKGFPWGAVRLVISAGEVDKRRVFFKALEKTGSVEHFEAWSVEKEQWIAQAETLVRLEFRVRQKEISDAAVAILVQSVGPNRQQLVSEVEKISLFSGEQASVTESDVNSLVTRNKQARAFALADALGNRDLPRVLRTLDGELWDMKFDKQKSEIGLLYGLISKVRTLIFLKEMLREGWIGRERDYATFKGQLDRVPQDRLPSDRRFNPLAMHPFMLFKALPQAANYSLRELTRAMNTLLTCNQRLIYSGLDESLVLQQALVQIVRGEREELVSSAISA